MTWGILGEIYQGRYYRRVGKTNQRMSHEEIMQKMIMSSGISWDAAVETRATLEDLDEEQIRKFISLVREAGRKPLSEGISDKEILRKMEFIKSERPTRAAILLFGKNPQSYFYSAYLKIGRFRSETHIVDDREAKGGLFNQLEEAMGWFRERLETEFVITGNLAREVKWEYPLPAIREAIINVLSHRDYTIQASSQIRLYDEHLTIRNLGGLPAPLTTDLLFEAHDSIKRNPKIAEAFFYAGFIESWGSGTTRIIDELNLAKLPKPQFESEFGGFKVTFYRQDEKHEYVENAVDNTLSARQKEILSLLRQHGLLSTNELKNLLSEQLSDRWLRQELNELLALKKITVQGKTTSRKWILL